MFSRGCKKKQNTRDKSKTVNCFLYDNRVLIDATAKGGYESYVNHRCAPILSAYLDGMREKLYP